jgi:hypothetical protein
MYGDSVGHRHPAESNLATQRKLFPREDVLNISAPVVVETSKHPPIAANQRSDPEW